MNSLNFACVKILLSEMDAAAAVIADGASCFEEKGGLPVEAFAKVQEIFNHVDWLDPKSDVALNVLQQISASVHDKLDKISSQQHDTGCLLHEKDSKVPQEKKNEAKRLLPSKMNESPDSDSNLNGKVDELIKTGASPQQHGSSVGVYQKVPITSSGSLSPKTPPQNPSLSRSSDTSPNTQLPSYLSPLGPGYPVTGEIEAQSQTRSESSIFSSTSGTSLSNTFPNKLPLDAASQFSASSATSAQHSPSPATPLKVILPVRTKSASSTSQPPAPPTPPTPPLKEHKLLRSIPPPPPLPPKKEQSQVRVITSLPSPKEKSCQLGPLPLQPPSLKDEPKVKAGPPPPPPPPPLKVEPSARATPPPPTPPPPPRLPRKADSTKVLPPPPPPPPSAELSFKHPNPLLQKSTPLPAAPNAPPPPASISKGNTVSSTTPRGRILSRTISSTKNQNKKLKPLHWLKISRAVQGSLWHDAAKSGEASKYV